MMSYAQPNNRDILANLHCRPMKLGRLIVLWQTHLWQLTVYKFPPTWFPYVGDLQLKKLKQGHKLELTFI